jgi:hypothetical protein
MSIDINASEKHRGCVQTSLFILKYMVWLKVHVDIEYQTVCPRVGIGTPAVSRKRGDTHLWVREGVGKSRFQRLEKKLSTRLLCGVWYNLFGQGEDNL